MDSAQASRSFNALRAAGLSLGLIAAASAQQANPLTGQTGPTAPQKADIVAAPPKVDVQPVARDEEIATRLQNVLEATGWFESPSVKVEDGVVFLDGQADSEQLKKWAGDLARNTQDVVAAVNRMGVRQPSAWDFAPARRGLTELWQDFIRSLPLILFGLLILVLSGFAGLFATRGARVLLRKRIAARLLRNVVALAIGLLVFLLGTYIVLRVSGLTQLALTIVGGTGLVGLIIGIAFRDITENFLASIFLSMQRPFETGDLVEIDQVTGYVQQLNVRTTIVMTLEGNLVQIPNSTVYKSNLCNFTTNANRREDFVVGIGYDDPINKAQDVARTVLAEHPAVLRDPEPWVLADSLGSATVNLRVYFWLNGREHSWLKVRSSVIRLIKRAFQENGISMPDESREVVFPRGVPVEITHREPTDGRTRERARGPQPAEANTVSTPGEGSLLSDSAAIEDQARQSTLLEESENLLKEQV